jgi:DNA-directed RNA polymerase sigma subunit (sigma70/sigma32)
MPEHERCTDPDDRSRLFDENLYLVGWFAGRYKTDRISRDDLEQEGAIALLEAIDRCEADPPRVGNLGSVAALKILVAFQKYFARQAYPVALPYNLIELPELGARVNRRRARFAGPGRYGINRRRGYARFVPPERFAPPAPWALERVVAPDARPEPDPPASVDPLDLAGPLDLAVLTPRQREVVTLRRGPDGSPLSGGEIARRLGCTRQAVFSALKYARIRLRRLSAEPPDDTAGV